MLKLAVLFFLSLIYLSTGFIRTPDDISGFEDNWLTWGEFQGVGKVVAKPKDPLWVLKFGGDLDDLKLRRGSEGEEEYFEDAFGHLIASSRQKAKKNEKPTKNNDKTSSTDAKLNKQLENEIMRVVNKFVLSTKEDPDTFLSDSDIGEEPSLALYFKGPYTSLTVQLGNKQWHYFLGSSSSLPTWFYRQYSEDVQVVPGDVKTDLYKALVHMLQMFLSFPV